MISTISRSIFLDKTPRFFQISYRGSGALFKYTFAGVFTIDYPFWQRETAGSHDAVFATNPLDAAVTGFHRHGPVKCSFYAQIMGSLDHLLGSNINRCGNWIGQFFYLDFGCFFPSAI